MTRDEAENVALQGLTFIAADPQRLVRFLSLTGLTPNDLKGWGDDPTLAIAVLLGLLITKTRYGKIVRAAAVNPSMVSALGINTGIVYASVFVLGGLLAGLAGGLAAPVRSLTAGMGLSVVVESFIVTVIGGMGSVAGALVGSVLVGLVRSFGTIGFPLFTEGLMFLLMAVVLVLKPSGLFGKGN